MNKKAQVNQIFIYILSIIIIVFVGFLVTKFIVYFIGAQDDTQKVRIYDDLQEDYDAVYKNFGSERPVEYRLSEEVEYICFSETAQCIDNLNELSDSQKEEFKATISTNQNIAQFDTNMIINANDIGEFETQDGCFCIKPEKNKINLFIENRRNTVWISEDIYVE